MDAKNRSRWAVLGVLSLGPQSGYDVKQLIERSVANFWRESYGQIYPTLRALEAEGLTERRVIDQVGKPDRHVYSLTDAGREAFRNWLAQPPAEPTPRIELLLKLFFGRQATRDELLQHISAHRSAQLQLLARYEAIDRELATGACPESDVPYWRLTVSYGRHVAQAALTWSDEAATVIRQLPADSTAPDDGSR